ncbi:MAG: sigma factor [Nitriliruptoraceae bacterium]
MSLLEYSSSVRSSALLHAAFPQATTPEVSSDTVESLLVSVGRGNHEAFAVLQSRMAGLVRVNVCRVLGDASRSDEVTQETFAAVFEDAIHFDPHRDSAQSWLLTRAHQHAIAVLPHVDVTGDAQATKLDQSEPALLP